MEVDIPTGFVVMNDTLRSYVQARIVPNLKRAEFYYRKVVFYFDYVSCSLVVQNLLVMWFMGWWTECTHLYSCTSFYRNSNLDVMIEEPLTNAVAVSAGFLTNHIWECLSAIYGWLWVSPMHSSVSSHYISRTTVMQVKYSWPQQKKQQSNQIRKTCTFKLSCL